MMTGMRLKNKKVKDIKRREEPYQNLLVGKCLV